MIKSVALIGTESVGKTTLAKELAKHYNAIHVPEYARIYLKKRTELGLINSESTISIDDVAPIVVGQLNLESLFYTSTNQLVFFDTTVFMSFIYSKYYFNYSPTWLERAITFPQNQRILLLQPDIEFMEDPQRGNTKDRLNIHDLIREELHNRKIGFKKIEGNGGIRLENAIQEVDRFIKK